MKAVRLIVCAMPAEAEFVLSHFAAHKCLETRTIGSGEHALVQSLYMLAETEASAVWLAVSGVGEHNAVSCLAHVLHRHLQSVPWNTVQVTSFGAVGYYIDSLLDLHVEDVVSVSTSCKFDAHIPLPGYEWHTPAFELAAVRGVPLSAVCLTGASFSEPEVLRRWKESGMHAACSNEGVAGTDPPRPRAELPVRGDVEDMELYALASFCASCGIRLSAIKFVTNACCSSAVDDFVTHFGPAGRKGAAVLASILALDDA